MACLRRGQKKTWLYILFTSQYPYERFAGPSNLEKELFILRTVKKADVAI